VVKRPRAKDLKIMDQYAGREIAGSMALLARVSTLSEEEVELLDADDLAASWKLARRGIAEWPADWPACLATLARADTFNIAPRELWRMTWGEVDFWLTQAGRFPEGGMIHGSQVLDGAASGRSGDRAGPPRADRRRWHDFRHPSVCPADAAHITRRAKRRAQPGILPDPRAPHAPGCLERIFRAAAASARQLASNVRAGVRNLT
jgi:hypothetical protein